MSELVWTTGRLANDGEDIYFETAGHGDALVFCHGLGGNHAVWFQQVPVFAESFRCVTWDQRGFGMSTNSAGQSGPAAAVTDLLALFDHLGIERAHMVGQSMGGWAVLGFALRAPERVISLVIADSTAGVMTDEIASVFAQGTRAALPRSVVGEHPAIGKSLQNENPTKAFLYQQIGSFRSNIDDAEMVGRLMSTRYDVDAVRAMRLPTLLVVGADDDLIPPAAIRELGKVIHGSQVAEIEGSGHSPYFERPDEWNRAVSSFLSS